MPIKKVLTRAYHSVTRAVISRGRSPQWRSISSAYERENPKCAACGATTKLQVHHVMPFHLDPALELDVSNFVTLCMEGDNDCHLRIGHGGNFRAYNPKLREHLAILAEDKTKRDQVILEATTLRRYE